MARLYKTAFELDSYKATKSYLSKDNLRKKRKKERENKKIGRRNKNMSKDIERLIKIQNVIDKSV